MMVEDESEAYQNYEPTIFFNGMHINDNNVEYSSYEPTIFFNGMHTKNNLLNIYIA